MTHEELVERSATKIREILAAHLPPATPLWLFGSRARGDAGFASDFDVIIDADVDRVTLGWIEDEIEESFVPFDVDLVLRSRLHGSFADRILQEAKPWN